MGIVRLRADVVAGVAAAGVVEAAGVRSTAGGLGPVRQWGWPTYQAFRSNGGKTEVQTGSNLQANNGRQRNNNR